MRLSQYGLECFELIVNNFPDISSFRLEYQRAVSELRPLFSTLAPYVRPAGSRGAHPFMQSDFPEIRRDKFEPGEILSKRDFARRAVARPSPLQVAAGGASKGLPEDLRVAIDFIIEVGEQITELRAARVADLRVIAEALSPLRKALDERKSPEARAISEKFNVAWIAACVDAMGPAWPDKELPLRYMIGFPVVFDIPDSGVYRPDEQPAEISERDFKKNNTRMVAKISAEIAAGGLKTDATDVDRRSQCWKRTKEEIESGLVSAPRSRAYMDRKYKRGRWRCIGRTAILQKGKWRCIDNGKRGKQNKAARMHERLTTSRADFPVMIAREFAARTRSGPGILKRSRGGGRATRALRLRHGTKDLAAAYRHVPTSQPEYTNVAVWDEDHKRVVYVEVPGHNFGLKSAVVNFNRFPALGVAIARRLCWCVVEHFYDDKDLTEPGWCGDSGFACLDLLFSDDFAGFPFEVSKNAPMRGANEYQGVVSDLSGADDGVLFMDVTRKRRDKLHELVSETLGAGVLRSGMAASIFGKARFMLSPVYGALGKACLQPIMQREYAKGSEALTTELEDSLEFVKFVCDFLPPVELPTLPSAKPTVVVFTDAEGTMRSKPKKGRKGKPPSGHLGFVVYHPIFGRRYAHAPVPANFVSLLDSVKERQTYIGQFELLAAITPFLSLPREWFEGYPVELWVDNSGAVGALIKGYSGIPDCARIVNMFHFAFAQLGAASLFIDYVPSESNPADVPSRVHSMSAEEAASELAEFGELVKMHVPEFADGSGEWLSLVSIAESLWGAV